MRVDSGRLRCLSHARWISTRGYLGCTYIRYPSSSFTKTRSVCCPVSSGASGAGLSKRLLALCDECIQLQPEEQLIRVLCKDYTILQT